MTYDLATLLTIPDKLRDYDHDIEGLWLTVREKYIAVPVSQLEWSDKEPMSDTKIIYMGN